LAAGSKTGESYILGAALRTVVERHNPRIRIALLETGGTAENLRMLEDGRAALATAQADVPAGPTARVVAVLYDDAFQLLTRRDSPLQNFTDLRGKTIALARSGGQFQSFLRIAEHFGLQESDFRFIGASDETADKAFSDGGADAVFRVRALGSPAILRLVRTGRVRLMRIDHAAAMRINQPAWQPAVIPAGAYLENPAEPPGDLPSVSVQRTLLASSAIDDETVRAVTGALIDNRQEIAEAIPDQSAQVRLLLAQVRRPELRAEMGPVLHPGALKFYERNKPPFLLAHADYIRLILAVTVMLGSWIWEFRAWMRRKQKNVADEYSNRAIALMGAAREAKSLAVLEKIRGELLAILAAAVGDLDRDKVSEESFDSFRAILQIGLEVVRDRWTVLQTAAASRLSESQIPGGIRRGSNRNPPRVIPSPTERRA
jgi:TRAP transporter TAXI family solute receptor